VTELVAVRRSECERAEVAGQVGIAPSGKGFLVERESDGRVLWPLAASSSAAQSDQLRRLKLERVSTAYRRTVDGT
jgi:hypothetical protein